MLFLAAIPAAGAEDRDIDRLSNQADAIVVGEVQSGRQTGYAVTFTLSVIRTLKGELMPGATASVSWASGARANRSLQGNYGLWFLGKSAGWTLLGVLQGQYAFEFAYLPLQKAISPATAATVQNPTANDLVATELATALGA